MSSEQRMLRMHGFVARRMYHTAAFTVQHSRSKIWPRKSLPRLVLPIKWTRPRAVR